MSREIHNITEKLIEILRFYQKPMTIQEIKDEYNSLFDYCSPISTEQVGKCLRSHIKNKGLCHSDKKVCKVNKGLYLFVRQANWQSHLSLEQIFGGSNPSLTALSFKINKNMRIKKQDLRNIGFEVSKYVGKIDLGNFKQLYYYFGNKKLILKDNDEWFYLGYNSLDELKYIVVNLRRMYRNLNHFIFQYTKQKGD